MAAVATDPHTWDRWGDQKMHFQCLMSKNHLQKGNIIRSSAKVAFFKWPIALRKGARSKASAQEAAASAEEEFIM